MTEITEQPAKPRKACYVGAPAIFKLEMVCMQLHDAFDCLGCYLVGSSIERADWRDVDVRMIMTDEQFARLFPNAQTECSMWEFDPRWLLMTTAITEWMRQQTGLPVDFQFQSQTSANAVHGRKQGKTRHAIGLRIARSE